MKKYKLKSFLTKAVTGTKALALAAMLLVVTAGTVKAQQNPGGVSGAVFWVKSDDAGTIATAWKDQAQGDHIPNVGAVALSAADRNHNFHPYTTGYSSSKYFHNAASVMNPTNGSLPQTNTSIFSAVRPTTFAAGRIVGIDDETATGAEPGVSITAAGLPREYEFFNTSTSSNFSAAFSAG